MRQTETEIAPEFAVRQAELPLAVVVCAWCKPKSGSATQILSHGICPRHLRQMRSKLESKRAVRPA